MIAGRRQQRSDELMIASYSTPAHVNKLVVGGMNADSSSSAVFSSKFCSAKIYCSILFVFGNNCLTID
jgi:hypothetical protein